MNRLEPDIGADPDDVQWTHEGFEVQLPALDAMYPHRMTVVGAVLGILLAAPVAMLGQPGSVFDLWLFAVMVLGVFGMVVGGGVGAWRSRRRTHVELDAGGLHAGHGSARWTAPWGQVTGVRVRGPRPWVVCVELDQQTLDVPVGEESNARWLAAHVAQRVRRFGARGGDDTDVPEPIRRLAARDLTGSSRE